MVVYIPTHSCNCGRSDTSNCDLDLLMVEFLDKSQHDCLNWGVTYYEKKYFCF